MTNGNEITREDIKKLQDEAAVAGDLAMVATCDKALATPPSDHAWDTCERVISEARENAG